jgi:CheY-like chemotaxis protein
VRILIVDDNEDSRDLTEAALVSGGYSDICIADSASEAFRLMDIGVASSNDVPQVDVVLLDVVMPEVDGIEACARIRGDARYSNTPIVMVTSAHDADTPLMAFEAGANDYITKPVDREALLHCIREALV